jgi:hypothetical protein
MRDDQFSPYEMHAAVGDEGYQRELADAVKGRLGEWSLLVPMGRALEFGKVLTIHAARAGVRGEATQLAQSLLRLSSEPASLESSDSDTQSMLDLVLVSPVLMRVARYVVLSIHAIEEEDVGALYRGWVWA